MSSVPVTHYSLISLPAFGPPLIIDGEPEVTSLTRCLSLFKQACEGSDLQCDLNVESSTRKSKRRLECWHGNRCLPELYVNLYPRMCGFGSLSWECLVNEEAIDFTTKGDFLSSVIGGGGLLIWATSLQVYSDCAVLTLFKMLSNLNIKGSFPVSVTLLK